MKTLSAVLVVCTLAILSSAEDAAIKATPSPTVPPAVVTLAASAAQVTKPLVLKDGSIGQPEQTELPEGGKAVFNFTIAKAGNYTITAVVSAPGEDSNSFFLNVDAPPEDPVMIWDIDVTNGFEERTVSWRGTNGDANRDEINPKIFNLSAGAHKLIIVGREPAQLKSISIRAAAH